MVRGIRGRFARASLKHGEEGFQEKDLFEYPGQICPGLIEAAEAVATGHSGVVYDEYPGHSRPGIIEAHIQRSQNCDVI